MKCPTCSTELPAGETVCTQCAPTIQLTRPMEYPSRADHKSKAGTSLNAESGAIIAGRYRVLERVGKGGMGSVYKVMDLRLDRVVALKTIHAEMAENPHALDLFKKELILARQVTHKNVCRVFDLGDYRGGYFLTMEYVEGQSLAKITKNKVKVPPAQAAEIMLQAAEGLQAAHETGIVHRDLKPDNIMTQPDGRVLVMDFGIARPATESGAGFSGTPGYASPEQLAGEAQDRRSDLFSLGLIFYELLLGEPPTPQPSTMAEARQRAKTPAPPLAERDSAIPKELSDIVMRCLAIKPQERFAGARELAQALDNWLHPKPVYAKPAFIWSSAAAVALVAAGGVWWVNRPPPPAPPPVKVLIADFENKTGEAFLDGVLEPPLQVALEGASFIESYDRNQAKRLITQLRPALPKLDPEGARLVAEREGVSTILSGSIEKQGNGYRLSLRTLSPDGKEIVKEQRETAPRDQVLAAAGRLATPVRRALGDRTSAREQTAAAETFTAASLEAASRYSAAQELASNPARREQAIPLYEEAIRLDPEMGRAYSGLAVAYRNLHRPAEALKNYELALSHISRMSERERLRTLGGYAFTANNYGKAADEYTTLVQKFPADTGGHSNLALTLLYLRQPARALEEGRLAVAMYPKNVSFRNNVALYALYAGDYPAAAQEAAAVLKDNPQVQTAYIAMALSALFQQHADQVQEWYKKMAALSPAAASMADTGLADLAVFEGRLDDAARILQNGIAADEARKDTGSAALKSAVLAQVYVELKRMPEARQAAERAAAGTVDPGALTESALAEIDAGAPAKAKVIADAFHEKVGAGNQVAAALIEGYAQMGASPVDAIDTFGKAQKILDTWLGHYLLGRANLRAKEYAVAYDEFQICLKRSGEAAALFLDEEPTARSIPPVWYYLAQADDALKDGKAAESYNRFIAFQSPRTQDPLVLLARAKLGEAASK